LFDNFGATPYHQNMAKKKKIMNGKMTIEKLARMSHGEFTAIRSEMKEGFDNVGERFDKVEGDIGILRRDMESGFGALAEILKEIRSDVKEVKSDVVTVNLDYAELKTRVERLEKKVGLSR